MLEWLNSNSGSVTSLLTIALIVLTGMYVRLTGKLVTDNEEMRRVATEPALDIGLSIHDAYINIINVRITNLGGGIAHSIAFLLDQKTATGVANLRELGPFKNGLQSLAPHQTLELFLANAFDDFDDAKTKPIRISAYWKDNYSKDYKKEFVLNLAELENISRIGKNPWYSMADSLNNIEKALKSLGTATRRLEVLSYSPDQHQNERRSQLLYGRLLSLSDAEKARVEELIRIIKKESE